MSTRNSSEGKGRRRQGKEPRKSTEKPTLLDSRKSTKKPIDTSELRKSSEKAGDAQERKGGKTDAAETRKSAGKTNDSHESKKTAAKSVDSADTKSTGKSKESPEMQKLAGNDHKSKFPKPKREVERIFGITDQRGKLEFSIKFKTEETVELIPTAVANVEYPQEVIKFYEDRLVWKSETK